MRKAEAEACQEEMKAEVESHCEEARAFHEMMMIMMMLGKKQDENNNQLFINFFIGKMTKIYHFQTKMTKNIPIKKNNKIYQSKFKRELKKNKK